jgi:hypothetical protein
MLVPVEEVAVPPGFLVSVHVPDEGKPPKVTLPVAALQSGCVIAPTTGGAGVTGCVVIVIFPVGVEVQPDALVTVNVYVFAERPEIVVVVPVPVKIAPSGVLVNVQVPVDGKLPNIILPVARVQLGWVIVPTDGTEGVDGCALMITLPDEEDVQPDELVTVKVYVLGASPEIVADVPVPE